MSYYLIKRDQLEEVGDPATTRERLKQISEHVRQESIPMNTAQLRAHDTEGKYVCAVLLEPDPPKPLNVADVAMACWYAALGKAREFTPSEGKLPKFKLNKDKSIDVTFTIKLPPM